MLDCRVLGSSFGLGKHSVGSEERHCKYLQIIPWGDFSVYIQWWKNWKNWFENMKNDAKLNIGIISF